MANFRVNIEIGAIENKQSAKIEAIVDTGAAYTWVPANVLARLNIQPTHRRRFRLADGRIIERDMSWMRVRVEGETALTPCIFGDKNTEPLLGAVTLEELGLGVDPINQRLIPIELMLVGFGIL